MPDYHATFTHSIAVKIVDADELEAICNTDPPWPHLTDEHKAFAGRSARIAMVSNFHGGRIVHQLLTPKVHERPKDDVIPGLWPEECLEDYCLHDPGFWGYPVTSEYFSIGMDIRGEASYAVVADADGVECLRVRCENAQRRVAAMTYVASKLHFASFLARYEITCSFDWRRETGFLQFWSEMPHDANRVLKIEVEGDWVRVWLRQKDGTRLLASFNGRGRVEQLRADGMDVLHIAECRKADDQLRHFRFINSDPSDSATLTVFADRATIEVL